MIRMEKQKKNVKKPDKLEGCKWKFNSLWENQWNCNSLKFWIRHEKQTKKRKKSEWNEMYARSWKS